MNLLFHPQARADYRHWQARAETDPMESGRPLQTFVIARNLSDRRFAPVGLRSTDKAMLRKLDRLLEECLRHPFEGTGKPQPLKGKLAGLWSRRIDREHRLVYMVSEQAIEIAQCRYHY